MNNENVSVKIGRKNYFLKAQSEQDKKNLLKASESVNKLVEDFLKGNPRMSNEDLLMLASLSLSHDLDSLKQQKESEEKMLEQLHNSLAEKLEKLM